MGGGFGDAFESGGLAGFVGWMGEAVAYRAGAGAEETVTAVVTRHAAVESVGEYGLGVARRVTVRIAESALGAAPARGDEVTVDGVVYGVESVSGPTGGRWLVVGMVEELVRVGAQIR